MPGNTPQLILTKYGYWTYEPKPSPDQLAEHYAKKYYQEGRGSYAVSYSDEEVRYFRLRASLVFRQFSRLYKSHPNASLLDVGCGEGWIMDKFQREGFEVRGIDFSSFAIEKFHPHLRAFFQEGNIYEMLNRYFSSGQKYDVVILANVIEHVIDPVELLACLKKLLKSEGMLLIVAPNDFSVLQQELLSKKCVDSPYWLAYPEHLSYFNKESMTRLIEDQGYSLNAVVAENPIDLNLLNNHSNYIQDKSKGKAVHMLRVRTDNFLASIDEDKLLDVYNVYGRMGVGRDLNYFCGILS